MAKTKRKRSPISEQQTHAFAEGLFSDDLHAKRVASLADATLGVVNAGSLSIHAIGRGLAAAKALVDKHAVKQVDRFVGNEAIDVNALFPAWVEHCVGDRSEMVVNLDWTDFDEDDHSMLVLSLQTPHGRAQPLLWKTVIKSELKDRRNDHEDDLLLRFAELVPEKAKVTVVADRAFGDRKLFRFLDEQLGFDFIIRFRSIIHVTDRHGEKKPAKDWLEGGRRTRVLRDAAMTARRQPVGMVVLAHDKGMKEPWCLAVSDRTLDVTTAKRLYGKRFTCEETFRDVKDLRLGFGLKWSRVSTPTRRDRLMLLATLAMTLLTLLGEAGERAGLDRLLKTNTSKKRTLSLLRQGLRWYQLIPNMPEGRLAILMNSYETVVREHKSLWSILNS